MGLGETLGGVFGGIFGADKREKNTDRERKRRMAILDSLNFQPMGATQRANNPMARRYLESFLAGNNPDTTFSGAPNAAATKAQQQQSQDAMFGTAQQNLDWGQMLRDAPMPQIKPEKAFDTERAPEAAKSGMPREFVDWYRSAGGGDALTEALAEQNPDLWRKEYDKFMKDPKLRQKWETSAEYKRLRERGGSI